MGLRRDVAQYDRDIRMLTDAIQRNAWDDEAGYFGYVMHDTAGRPVSLFRYKEGSNFNKGLDGVSPFVAGICTPRQTERILENLFSPTGCGPTSAFRPSTVRPPITARTATGTVVSGCPTSTLSGNRSSTTT